MSTNPPPSKKQPSSRVPGTGDTPPSKRVRRSSAQIASTSTTVTKPRPVEATAPISLVNRECPYCGLPANYLHRHVAASKRCAIAHAKFVHDTGKQARTVGAPKARRYYEQAEDSPLPDISIDEEESEVYDVDRDYAAIDRLRQLGILPQIGPNFAPRLKEVEVPPVDKLPLRSDIDFFLQDFAPNDDDSSSEESDLDPDPFDDDNDDPIPQSSHPPSSPSAMKPSSPPIDQPLGPKTHVLDDRYEENLYSLKFNLGRAGKPILLSGNKPKSCKDAYHQWEQDWKLKEAECPFRPFQNLMEWEICQWAKLSAPSKYCADWLLNIPTVS